MWPCPAQGTLGRCQLRLDGHTPADAPEGSEILTRPQGMPTWPVQGPPLRETPLWFACEASRGDRLVPCAQESPAVPRSWCPTQESDFMSPCPETCWSSLWPPEDVSGVALDLGTPKEVAGLPLRNDGPRVCTRTCSLRTIRRRPGRRLRKPWLRWHLRTVRVTLSHGRPGGAPGRCPTDPGAPRWTLRDL